MNNVIIGPILDDFPKLHCPFLREKISKSQYLVTDKINPGYEWVFDDEHTIAIEKLDGTNVKLKTENGRLIALQNRKNVIDPLQIMKGNIFIVEGVFRAIQKGYVNISSEQAGELIGPKLQGNPYNLENHIWYPFQKALSSLRYKSFDKYPRTFDGWSSWFKDRLKSLYDAKNVGFENARMAEGVIFYNLKRKDKGLCYRAKLRRDMWEWFQT